jgi:hypothetical protein
MFSQIPVEFLPFEYNFEKDSKYHNVVVQILPKKQNENDLKEFLLSTLSKLYEFTNSYEHEKNNFINVKRGFSPSAPPKLKKMEVKFSINSETNEIVQIKEKSQKKERSPLKKLKRVINETILSKNSNLPTLYDVYEGEFGFYLVYEYHPHSLDSILKFSKKLLHSSVSKRKFLFFQLYKV